VSSFELLSQLINSTDKDLLAGYGNLAHGVDLPRSQPTGYPDDLLKQRAFGRAPATRHFQNNVSRLIHEHYEPGMCWYLDLGPVHVADFEGNRFSRLGVDDTTGYALPYSP